jgi:hypothetical protein
VTYLYHGIYRWIATADQLVLFLTTTKVVVAVENSSSGNVRRYVEPAKRGISFFQWPKRQAAEWHLWRNIVGSTFQYLSYKSIAF